MASVVQMFDVATVSKQGMLEAVANLQFDDLEDSLQYMCAVESQCPVFLTVNVSDFKHADTALPEVMTPSEFVEKYIRKD